MNDSEIDLSLDQVFAEQLKEELRGGYSFYIVINLIHYVISKYKSWADKQIIVIIVA